MNHLRKNNWAMIVVAPFVVAGMLLGLWLAVMAAYENIRLAHATDQILGIVDIARDMGVNTGTNGPAASQTLLDRLAQLNGIRAFKTADSDRQAIANPWGEAMTIAILPPQQQLRIETRLQPSACRRLLQFYGREPASLGMQAIAIRSADAPNASWRSFFEAAADPKNQPAPDIDAMQQGCGQGGAVTLALTFRLRQ